MGGGLSVLSSEKANQLSRRRLAEFYDLERECMANKASGAEMFMILTKKFDELMESQREENERIEEERRLKVEIELKRFAEEAAARQQIEQLNKSMRAKPRGSFTRDSDSSAQQLSRRNSSKRIVQNDANEETSVRSRRPSTRQHQRRRTWGAGEQDEEAIRRQLQKDRAKELFARPPNANSSRILTTDTKETSSHTNLTVSVNTVPARANTRGSRRRSFNDYGEVEQAATVSPNEAQPDRQMFPRYEELVRILSSDRTPRANSKPNECKDSKMDSENKMNNDSTMDDKMAANTTSLINPVESTYLSLMPPAKDDQSVILECEKTPRLFDSEPGVFECHVCHKKFNSKGMLELHNTHSMLHKDALVKREQDFTTALKDAERLVNVVKIAVTHLRTQLETANAEDQDENRTPTQIRWRRAMRKLAMQTMTKRFKDFLAKMAAANFCSPDITMLYQGSKFFWRVKSTFSVAMYHHIKHDCVELILQQLPSAIATKLNSNNMDDQESQTELSYKLMRKAELPLTPRIYLRYSTILALAKAATLKPEQREILRHASYDINDRRLSNSALSASFDQSDRREASVKMQAVKHSQPAQLHPLHSYSDASTTESVELEENEKHLLLVISYILSRIKLDYEAIDNDELPIHEAIQFSLPRHNESNANSDVATDETDNSTSSTKSNKSDYTSTSPVIKSSELSKAMTPVPVENKWFLEWEVKRKFEQLSKTQQQLSIAVSTAEFIVNSATATPTAAARSLNARMLTRNTTMSDSLRITPDAAVAFNSSTKASSRTHSPVTGKKSPMTNSRRLVLKNSSSEPGFNNSGRSVPSVTVR